MVGEFYLFFLIGLNPILAFDDSKYNFNDNLADNQNKTTKILPIVIFLICVLALGIFITNKIRLQINKINREMSILEKDGRNLAAYIKDIQNKIKKNWNPPKEAASKYVTTKFIIGKNGELIDVTITESSNVKSVDDSALKAVRDSAPFEPLPKSYKAESIPIEFTFDYNIIVER